MNRTKEETAKYMANCLKAGMEIKAEMGTNGKIALAKVEEIAKKYNIGLIQLISETADCYLDTGDNTLKCR